MNVAAKRMQPSERKDMQGLLLTAYGGLPEASFLLLSIRDRAAAAAWLAAAPITCGDIRDASKVLQLALTAAGMRALGVPEAIIAGFSAEFVAGMAEEDGRSRRLGDLEANAPARWRWGYRSVPHVLAALYAEKGGLAAWRQRIADDRFAAGFEIIDELPTSDMGPKEPFGFTDGISQPRLDWDHGPRDAAALAEYGNLIAAGEFVLGYRNEYGFYTDRPSSMPASRVQPGFRLRKTRRQSAILAATARIWYFANYIRMSAPSGGSFRRYPATDGRSRRPVSGAASMGRRSFLRRDRFAASPRRRLPSMVSPMRATPPDLHAL